MNYLPGKYGLRWVFRSTQISWSPRFGYQLCPNKTWRLLHIRKARPTYIQDLSLTEADLWNNQTATNKYEIRRAQKDELQIERGKDYGLLIAIWNPIASNLNLFPKKRDDLATSHSHVVTTIRRKNGTILAAHYYIFNKTQRWVILQINACDYRHASSPAERQLMGRANRLLFWSDMLYFKNIGFDIFDWGGYTKTNPKNIGQSFGVNKFKLGFGGQIVTSWDYLPFHYYLYDSLRKIWRRLKKNI